MLFGFSSAVMGFNRWPRFLVAMVRRLLAVMWSMYFDDGTLRDLAVANGAGQRGVGRLFAALGVPLADHKRQTLQAEGAFLGLGHYVGGALVTKLVKLWPLEKTIQKAQEMVERALLLDRLTPGESSKLRGVLNFIADARVGKVARGGMAPLKQRQYLDVAPW